MAGCRTTSNSDPSLSRCSGGGPTNVANCVTTAAKSLQQIARCVRSWADDHASIVADADPDMGMINRNRDNWRPLFAIADVIGDDWPERIRDAAAALAPRESESPGPMLLADIKIDVRGKGPTVGVGRNMRFAGGDGQGGRGPSGGRARGAEADHKNQLAHLLRPFDIAPDTVRVGKHSSRATTGINSSRRGTAIWPRRGGFRTATTLQRLLPQALPPLFEPLPPDPDRGVSKMRETLFGHAHCDGVTFQKGGNGPNGETEDRCCRQCDGTLDGTEQPFLIGGHRVWLHPECRRFFAAAMNHHGVAQ